MLCSNKYENGYIFYYYVFHVSCYCQKPSKRGIGASGTERLISQCCEQPHIACWCPEHCPVSPMLPLLKQQRFFNNTFL